MLLALIAAVAIIALVFFPTFFALCWLLALCINKENYDPR